MELKYVISSHTSANLSGVAKFGHMLAKKIGVPFLGVNDIRYLKDGPVLLSMKLTDGSDEELQTVKVGIGNLESKGIIYDLFFHTFSGLDVEYQLIRSCRRIFCGNAEIAKSLGSVDRPVLPAWCPALLDTSRSIQESRLNIFSFGMAHKLQIKYYMILMELLQDRADDCTIWISTAFHEKAKFGDFNSLSTQLNGIFGSRIQMLGFLSDEAISYFLSKSHLFVAFFTNGVRANNTSVMAAMSKGCPVLTNCDEQSPIWMQHGQNVLDVHRTRSNDLSRENLCRVGELGQNDVNQYGTWERLIELISTPTGK